MIDWVFQCYDYGEMKGKRTMKYDEIQKVWGVKSMTNGEWGTHFLTVEYLKKEAE